MKVLKESYGDVAVLTLKGEFDSFVTGPFSNEIQKLQADGVHKIVLNMQLVTFINSTAMGSMIRARNTCKAGKGEVVVSQPSQVVREAMDSLGLEKVIAIHESDDSAIAALGRTAALDLSAEHESTVMLHAPELDRPLVGRLCRLAIDGLECRFAAPHPAFKEGREVRLKFRLPLYRREYFDVKARIRTVGIDTSGTVVALHFTEISDDDKEAIQRFLDDMDDLRGAAGGEG